LAGQDKVIVIVFPTKNIFDPHAKSWKEKRKKIKKKYQKKKKIATCNLFYHQKFLSRNFIFLADFAGYVVAILKTLVKNYMIIHFK